MAYSFETARELYLTTKEQVKNLLDENPWLVDMAKFGTEMSWSEIEKTENLISRLDKHGRTLREINTAGGGLKGQHLISTAHDQAYSISRLILDLRMNITHNHDRAGR